MFDIANMPASVEIGYTGEQDFRTIQIDMTKWMRIMPDGVPSIVHIRPGESNEDAYIVATTFEDNILTWAVSASDLGVSEGIGSAQVWLEESENDTLDKRGMSALFATLIRQSIGDIESTVPPAQMPWMQQMTLLKTETVEAKLGAEEAEADAVTAKEAAEYAQNKAEAAQSAAETARDAAQAAAGDFQDMSATVTGLDEGEDPTIEVTHSQGGYYNLAFGIPKGDKGDKGDQGDPPTDAQVQTAANTYLATVITNPDSPPLDRALSSAVSAAPADLVGDLKSAFKSRFYGKKISIIGDSIDTFDQAGYKIDGYRMYYPALGVTNVNQTWWKMVLDNSGATIEVNASWSGSRVTDTHSDPTYPDFYDRVSVIGSPDVIFVTLGTNDSSNSVALGEYDFDTAYISLSESEFRPAYIKGVKALKTLYPSAQIVCIVERMLDAYKESIEHIAKTLSVEFIDAHDYAMASGLHPGPLGMQQIAVRVLYPTNAGLWEKNYPADAYATGAAFSAVDEKIEHMSCGKVLHLRDGSPGNPGNNYGIASDDLIKNRNGRLCLSTNIPLPDGYQYYWVVKGYTEGAPENDVFYPSVENSIYIDNLTADEYKIGLFINLLGSTTATEYTLRVANVDSDAIIVLHDEFFSAANCARQIIDKNFDLDYLYAPGYYILSPNHTYTNAPTGFTYGSLVVFTSGYSVLNRCGVLQIARNTGDKYLYYRVRSLGAVWSAWTRIATGKEIETLDGYRTQYTNYLSLRNGTMNNTGNLNGVTHGYVIPFRGAMAVRVKINRELDDGGHYEIRTSTYSVASGATASQGANRIRTEEYTPWYDGAFITRQTDEEIGFCFNIFERDSSGTAIPLRVDTFDDDDVEIYYDYNTQQFLRDTVVGSDMMRRPVNVTPTGKLTYPQAFCMYDGKYISTNGSKIASQDSMFNLVTDKSISIGHGNSLQLGNSKYAYASGWGDNKLYVVDLESLTVTNTITLPTTGYTTCAVDEAKSIAYIFQRDTSPSSGYEAYNFIVYDYANEQVLRQSKTVPFACMQACDFFNDHIIVASGLATSTFPNEMRVYDTDGRVVAEYFLNTIHNEYEGVCLDRVTHTLFASDISYTVYRIEV